MISACDLLWYSLQTALEIWLPNYLSFECDVITSFVDDKKTAMLLNKVFVGEKTIWPKIMRLQPSVALRYAPIIQSRTLYNMGEVYLRMRLTGMVFT